MNTAGRTFKMSNETLYNCSEADRRSGIVILPANHYTRNDVPIVNDGALSARNQRRQKAQ